MFDLNHPFFLPLWRRYAVIGLCLVWAAFEVSTGAVFWAILFGAAGVYCIKALLISFDEDAARTRFDKDKS